MNAERLEIARRLVACPKWVWLPGMAFLVHQCECEWHSSCAFNGSSGRIVKIIDDGAASAVCFTQLSGPPFDGEMHDSVPDLDDDLTRLGVLAVVRRAWGDDYACVRVVSRHPLVAAWAWEAGAGRKREVGHAMYEIEALLFALEAAPA